MPSRAARWISAITSRSKVADSRNPGCHPPARSLATAISVAAEVLDVEVVEAPRRAVAAELIRVGVLDARPSEQLAELLEVLGSQLLLDAVRAQLRDRPAHVQARLVQRVAERLTGVAAHDQRTRLGHERAHVATEPWTTTSA